MANVKWGECICHGYSKVPGKEQKFTEEAWTKLCNSAKRRKDHVYDNLCPYIEGSLPLPVEIGGISRHENCYKSYTLEKSLLTFERKRSANASSIADSQGISPEKRFTRSEAPQIDLAKCIICHERFLKDTVNRRKFHSAKPFTLQSAVEKLRDAAHRKGDKRILCQLSGGARGGDDAIAGDVLKHDSCYNKYIKIARASTSSETITDGTGAAFHDIVSLIQKNIIEDAVVWDMGIVHSLYAAILSKHQVDPELHANLLKRLKDKLIQHFGNQLVFHNQPRRNAPQLLFTAGLDVGRLVYDYQVVERKLQEEQIENEFTSGTCDEPPQMHDAYTIAMQIHRELKDITNMEWPPTPDCCTLVKAKSMIPPVLFNLISWILSGVGDYTEEYTDVDESKETRVIAICQDILYAARNGRVQTPKHVSLAMAIRRVTGRTDLVTMLNGYGHTVSSSKLQEIEAAIGELRQHEGGERLPANIVKHVPVSFVFDNNDFREETPSGHGTTHCTNGIIIQPRVYIAKPKPGNQCEGNEKPSTMRKQRTLPFVEQALLDYPCAPRHGPNRVDDACTLITTGTMSLDRTHDEDMAWLLARLQPDLSTPDEEYSQVVPGWSRTNQMLQSRDDVGLPHSVGYMPVINESPSDLATVFTVLSNAIDVVDASDYGPSTQENAPKPSVVVTVDQAVYAKAVEVVNNPHLKDDFERFVLRLGAFHTGLKHIDVIGCRYASAGLRDILVEAGIVAEGSVDQVLNGRHYNRAIKALKTVYEAMWRLRWDAFLRWRDEENLPDFQELLQFVSHFRRELSSVSSEQLITSTEFASLKEEFGRFTVSCGPNAKFWSEFIDMVELLLCFIRSTRVGNWLMHLECLQKMLPWMVAYDRTNYSRYLPVYILQMKQLPETHPDAHAEFLEGNFAVQRKEGNAFSRIAHDQTIEVTINKDTKTSGGLIGKTLRHESVNQWVWTAADKAQYYQCSKALSGMSKAGIEMHKDGSIARVKHDEAAVQTVMSTVTNLIDPFTHQDVVTHVASGKHATLEIQTDLLSAGEVGLKQVHKFATDRLGTDGETDFHDPLPKLGLKTFASFTTKSKKVTRRDSQQETTAVFAHLYDGGQRCQVNRDELMSYELTSVPRSLADADGAKLSATKSDLLHILRDKAEDVPHPLQANTTHIIDAMAVLQSLNPQITYDHLALQVFKFMLKGTGMAAIVHWVVDTYPVISIKDSEHAKRDDLIGVLHYSIKSGKQPVPSQYKRALRCGPYKEELLSFLLKSWTDDTHGEYAALLHDRTVYVTSGKHCVRIHKNAAGGITSIPQGDLMSNHEEADTRLLLHAKHASLESDAPILIRSPDTDVLVLAVYLCCKEQLQLLFRVQNNKAWSYISVTSIADNLGPSVCDGLLGMHAFSGCDSTSRFAGHGKRTAFKLLMQNTEFCQAMKSLGENFDPDSRTLKLAEKAICHLYNSAQCSNTNNVRSHKWNRQTTDITKLPPCHDSAILHIRRANYQAAIWKRCLESEMEAPSPHGHGWVVHGSDISIVWMSQQRAPSKVLDIVKCSCKSTTPCSTRKCRCRQQGHPCMVVCMCSEDCCNAEDVATSDDSDIE